MKPEIIKSMAHDFEANSFRVGDIEFWYARSLQELLGYNRWESFSQVIEKAKNACKNAHQPIENHFRPVLKMVDIGSGSKREVEDYELTRYASYLIAQNGDSRKEQIAFAMSYFAVQTRKFEILQERINELERIRAREKLSETERQFSGTLYQRGVDDRGFGVIRSKGDQALFGGKTTNDMKIQLSVPEGRPLADFLPTITIKAKDFATEITLFNVKKDDKLNNPASIENEHVKNNQEVRGLLTKQNIFPEKLPPGEDIKKIQRKVESERKKLLKPTKSLSKKKNGK
ncbi:MAG TPA: DNA damage-inducible protein D [Bacteroidota bacterium]|nr:DNA damage-inducible protein D [Bacteroidota bacterium]